jgi:hypothetical protein
VLFDDTTAKLIESRFVVEHGPDAAPRLLRERLDADTSRPLLGKPTPCIGREAELSMLDNLFQSCRDDGTPTAVLLTAPPGMGKSRLRHEFIRRITAHGEDILVLLGRGDAMSAGSSYGLLSQAILRLVGAQDGEPLSRQQDKLRQRIALHVPAAEVDRVHFFIAEMCSIPFRDEDSILLRAARQDPSAMSEQVSRALLDLLQAECAAHPVVLVLEDLHWGDALTVRLVHEALRTLTDAPLLVLATARPEISDVFPKLWAGRLQVVSLTRLGKKACEQLIKQVLGEDIGSSAIAQIIERAGGNALYLEELIRAAAEGNRVGLPETVLAMVQARLLRVPAEARRILRAASVFGETFWRGGVIGLCGGVRRAQQIDSMLETLIESETIEARSTSRFPAEQEYTFRHALVRDAAYSMIPLEEQQGIHKRAGEYLERCGERDPMILAEHFLRGGEAPRGVEYLVHATEQAYLNNDTDAVLLRARRGLECGATGETRGILLVNLGRARGWKDDDWSAGYAHIMEALDLVPAGSMWWYRGMYSVLFLTSMAGMRKEFAALIARFTAAQPQPAGRGAYVEAAASLVVSLSMLGMRAQARQLLADMDHNAGDLIKTDPTTQGFMRYAQAVSSRFCEADPWAMLQSARQSCAAFAAAANRHAMILGGGILAASYLDLGDLEQAESVARANFAMAQKLGDHFVVAQAAMVLVQVLASRGSSALEEGIALCEAVMSRSSQPIFAGRVGATLTQLLAACGQIERAVEVGKKASQQLTLIAAEYFRSVIAVSNALLLHQEPQAARELCEQALRRFTLQESRGFAEVGLFLATARARNACGAQEEARAALREGLARLQARADLIPDAAARTRYLDHPSDNAPLRALAHKWSIGDGIQ